MNQRHPITVFLPLMMAPLIALLAGISNAEQVYVRDTVYVPLRSGQSIKHGILHQGIRSGTALEKLDTNEDTGYSLVRTESGLEGWMLSQYLVSTPIAADLLDETSEKLNTLDNNYQQALAKIDQQLRAFETKAEQLITLEAAHAEVKQDLQRITELSAGVIRINQQNKALKTERSELNQEINDLYNRNSDLENTTYQSWFLGGACTVLILSLIHI